MNTVDSVKKEIKRGDIYYVDFGSNVGSEQSGLRPVLCVSNNIGNKYGPTIIVIPLTTKFAKRPLPTHVEIPNYIECGLKERSQVLAEQVRVIDKMRIKGEVVGRVDDLTMRKIDRAIEISIEVGSAKVRPDSRIIQTIKFKVEGVKALDSLLVEMFLSEDRDMEVLLNIAKERELRLNDLKIFANENNADYKKYYDPITQNKLNRMVG